MSKIISSFTGRELKQLGQVDLNKVKDVTHNDLKNIGFDCKALDSAINQMGVTNGALSGDFLTEYLSGTVRIGTTVRVLDEILGITTVGEWHDDKIALRVSQPVGKAELYGDLTNIPLSSYIPSIEERNIVRFEQGFMVTKLESARQDEFGFNEMEEKRMSSIESLEIMREEVGYRGFASTGARIYGLLNDPSLPGYKTNLSNWLDPNTTFAQILADIEGLFSDIEVRSGSRAKESDNMTLTIPTGYRVALSKTNPDNQNETVRSRLNSEFPNMRVISSSEFRGANAGDDIVYLIVDKAVNDGSTDGGEAIIQAVPVKYKMLGSEQTIKGYVEDATNALAGVFVKRPWLVSRGSIAS
ncbi:hypothetical protein ACNSOP_09155 [Aliarcobacter lanthieri]|uniref:hypothetical protein n=1 Tax=Aliarcobacter lanthieri TaxID=1355374 RepID=UPI003AA98E28